MISSYLFIGLVFLLVILISVSTSGQVDMLEPNEIYEFNHDWTITYEDEPSFKTDLPYTMEIPVGHTVKMSNELPQAFQYPTTLRLRSSMQYHTVSLDGRVIYQTLKADTSGFPREAEASAWVLIDIPAHSQGKELDIHLNSLIPVMSGRLNEIYYGSQGDLNGNLLNKQILTLVIAVFILSVGVFTFIVSMMVRGPKTLRIRYLCSFSVSIGIWLISESDIMQFFTTNKYFVGTISYYMLPIAAASFQLFMKEVVLEKYSRYLEYTSISYGIYLVLSMVLQVFMGIDLIRIWPLFMIMLLVNMIIIAVLLLIESLKNNKQANKYIFILSVLLLTTVIETLMFLTDNFMKISDLSSIGIFIFLLLLVVDTLSFVNSIMQKEGESKYLREIAFKDVLTGGLNRTAFEKAADQRLNAKAKKLFRLSMYDLNNLKLINDKHGHETGDQALKDFYNLLKGSLDKDATCYRVGGDEFMVIHDDISEQKYAQSLAVLRQEMAKRENLKGYPFQVSAGSGIYAFDMSFGDFKYIVDTRMYENKKDLKAKIRKSR